MLVSVSNTAVAAAAAVGLHGADAAVAVVATAFIRSSSISSHVARCRRGVVVNAEHGGRCLSISLSLSLTKDLAKVKF